MTDLGERIRNERMRRNMSVDTLSKETKTLQEQIKAMENRKAGFGREKLQFMLDYLGIKTHPAMINKYYDECHRIERMMKCTVLPASELPAPEKEDDMTGLLAEITQLKQEIEIWLKEEPKGMSEWISSSLGARKLLTKVVEKL